MLQDSDKNDLLIVSMAQLPITQHIRYGLTPSPFGTLLTSVATSYMRKLSGIGLKAL